MHYFLGLYPEVVPGKNDVMSEIYFKILQQTTIVTKMRLLEY